MSTKQPIQSGYGYDIYTDHHNGLGDSLTVELTEYALLYAGMTSTPTVVRAELVLTLNAACETGLLTNAELLTHFGQNNLNKVRQTVQLEAKDADYTDRFGKVIAENSKRKTPKPPIPIVQDDGVENQTIVRAVQGYTLYAAYCKDGRAVVRLHMQATPSAYVKYRTPRKKTAKPALKLDVFEINIKRLDDGLTQIELGLSLAWMQHLGWVSQQWFDDNLRWIERNR